MKKLKPVIRKIEAFTKSVSFKIRPEKYSFKPIFIIGCGRSGTTILGKSLSKHPSICYLNERRDLWHTAFPELDIWSGKAASPKVIATEDDYNFAKATRLANLFRHEQAFLNSAVLLEKLPINNFRLGFLNKCFPDAKYIYLHRNGLEVATSISKRIPKGWYGQNNMKLDLLLEYSNTFTKTNITKTEIDTDFKKGLFEWGFSMEQSDVFFKALNPSKFISLSYQDFVDNTGESLVKMFSFMEVSCEDSLISKIVSGIERKNEQLKDFGKDYDQRLIEKLGRGFLDNSIENKYFKI